MLTPFFVRLSLLRSDTKGITALEYALLAAFVALAIVSSATVFGSAMSRFFNSLATTVNHWPN